MNGYGRLGGAVVVEVAKDPSASKCQVPQKVVAEPEHAQSCADLVEKALKNLIVDPVLA